MKALLVFLGLLLPWMGSVIHGEDKAGPVVDKPHVLMRTGDIQWGTMPPGLSSGAQMGVLLGDPAQAGSNFVVRLKMPDGYRVMPHRHGISESITVLKGTLLVGHGDTFDPSLMEELTVGSFWHMPQGMHHYVRAQGETIIQIHGVGPFDITYLNPADDPRKKDDKK